MSERTITRKSRAFYEQFQFPGDRPIDQDGLIFMRRFTRSIERCRQFNSAEKLRVLDAGCGTGNTSVALARRWNDVEFYGLDNSQTSLAKAAGASRKDGLANIHFRRWNLMNSFPYKRPFDIALCLGVLHHTADMKRGLLNIHNVLKNNGELYLWIYGKHGRYKHSLNMRLLAMLLNTAPKPTERMALAKEFIFNSGTCSPLLDLVGKTQYDSMQQIPLEDPVWIADQFLNPHEVLIDMTELIETAKSAGFTIEHLLGVDEEISHYLNSPSLRERFKNLKKDMRLIALDLLIKPERYFVVLKKSDS